MKLESLVCPICGCRDINPKSVSNGIGVCPACDETFVIKIAEQLSLVEVDKTKEIGNLRALLKEAVSVNDIRSIARYSGKLLEIIENDFSAIYYYAYSQNVLGQNRYITKFYSTEPSEHTVGEMKDIVAHITEYCDLRDEQSARTFISHRDDIDTALSLADFDVRFAERMKQEEYYDDIPRDVFICHRSTNSDIANVVCEALEEDGNVCWISSRNLRPNDTENYWTNIERAIKSCKIFLVISGRDAMLSKDVKREMEYAASLEKPRVEYKIDSSEHTTFFKIFFDGLQWVDGTMQSKENISDLRLRIYRELEESDSFFDVDDESIDASMSQDENEELFRIEVLDRQSCAISGLDKKTENVIIPDMISGMNVTEINMCSFMFDSRIESVTMPPTIRRIGQSAFQSCTSLKSVLFSDKLDTIDPLAFVDCHELESVILPDSLKKIGESAFRRCSSLTVVEIPNGVTHIGYGAFCGCDRLTTVFLPASLKTIGREAFNRCSTLENVFYKGSTSDWEKIDIGDYNDALEFVQCGEAFDLNGVFYCGICGHEFKTQDEAINCVHIGTNENVADSRMRVYRELEKNSNRPMAISESYIEEKPISEVMAKRDHVLNIAFVDDYHCTVIGLKREVSHVIIPNTYCGKPIVSIDDHAFEGVVCIRRVTISSGIEEIGANAFSGCPNLSEVVIDGNVKTINQGAFSECPRLHTVEIGDGVETIDDAFYDCPNLNRVSIGDGTKELTNNSFSPRWGEESELHTLTIGEGLCDFDWYVDFPKLKKLILPNSLRSCGSLKKCPKLELVKYDNALYLGNDSNPYLVLVRPIDNSITSCSVAPTTKIIADDAFSQCTFLNNVDIPSSVITIGSSAFDECTGLTEINIPDSVDHLGSYAFSGCVNIKNITLGKGLKHIGANPIALCYDCDDECAGKEYAHAMLKGLMSKGLNIVFKNPNNWCVKEMILGPDRTRDVKIGSVDFSDSFNAIKEFFTHGGFGNYWERND